MNEHMDEALPALPIAPESLAYLVAVMLVYRQYLQRKRLPSDEQQHTLFVLMFLLPKLQQGIGPHKEACPLWLTVDEVQVIKRGLATMLDRLKHQPASQKISREIARLKQLKMSMEQTFSQMQE